MFLCLKLKEYITVGYHVYIYIVGILFMGIYGVQNARF